MNTSNLKSETDNNGELALMNVIERAKQKKMFQPLLNLEYEDKSECFKDFMGTFEVETC